jgi:hypothetical protein
MPIYEKDIHVVGYHREVLGQVGLPGGVHGPRAKLGCSVYPSMALD